MLNDFFSVLIDLFVLWLERFSDYFFFYDNTKSHWTRFKQKRRQKLYLIKIIINELKLVVIDNLREWRDALVEHNYPSRFYWHCYEDSKFLIILIILLKLPTSIHNMHFWGAYGWQELHGWDYKHERRMTALPVRLSIYYGEGNSHIKKLYFSRPDYKDKFWVNWIFYKLILYWYGCSCCMTNFLVPLAYRIYHRGSNGFAEKERVFFEWYFGWGFMIFFRKYVHWLMPYRLENDFHRVYGELHWFFLSLQDRFIFERDYWLWSDFRIGDPSPSRITRPLEKEEARRKWPREVLKYEDIEIRPSVNNYIVSAIIQLLTIILTVLFIATFVTLKIVLWPVKKVLIFFRDILIVIGRFIIIVIEDEF